MLPSLPADKANHVVYGNAAAFAGALLGPRLGLTPSQGAWLATVTVAALKEIWDAYTGKGKPELADFLATCAGGAPVSLVSWQLQP